MSVAKRAEHPHAALLFVDFMLSLEGQRLIQKVNRVPASNKVDSKLNDFPYEMMTNVCNAVKAGGRVVFVEYRGEDPHVPIKPLHKMTEAQLRKEMSVQPLEWVRTNEKLPRQRLVEFRKR